MFGDIASDEGIMMELARLHEVHHRVRPWNVFGDDNRGAIQAQITVLEENLSESQVYRRFGEEAFLDADEFSDHILQNALAAWRWRVGDHFGSGSLADDWADLVVDL